ncbi:sirohydrochlorin chelatase [Allostreptomyces psammosilenae]|uniref:Sirohydrochlorin ferrochelatase n=1 Tax=Allostreptomyces psammosilenae TaxID=1892865 RepID=A0A853AA34_9ACTN|nr:hypothetical protein [Allostreptomyces psammosilenae]NYI07378.1 sirohydrochlorin ferrochelatase [Allostreptomyces psammosilenae]
MSSADLGSSLPVRTPRARQRGRHRRPQPLQVPPGAPPLVLAVPDTDGSPDPRLAQEIASLVRAERPGVQILLTAGPGAVRATLAELAELRRARRSADGAGDRSEQDAGPVAIVVPLLVAPVEGVIEELRKAVVASGVEAVVTDPLGPHPVLAEALHVRLSEAGLARADRARLFTVSMAADGIVLATAGGEAAVAEAQTTGVLLAARLAVPVLPASVDVPGSVAAAAEQLRASGAGRIAVAPFLIGPEADSGRWRADAEQAGCECAEPLGAYSGIAPLILERYVPLVGVVPEEEPAGDAPAEEPAVATRAAHAAPAAERPAP